ncbi:Cilia- and flagella-associated protein 69 [Lamellibrachia satsuma]|nr:Cilia- and flagella-associated protein 69 [Lamellibrachia satsuma]
MATTMQVTVGSGSAIHRQSRRLQPMEKESDRAVMTNIPLVGHIITDDDIGFTEGNQLKPINLKRVIKLLLDPHSCMLYDRHVHAVMKVARHYKDGYLLKDLVSVFRILNVCADRVTLHAVYAQCMVSLLKPCSLPFFQEKTSDEFAFEQIAKESVSQLGYLMRVPNSHVRKQICETLMDFYSGPVHTSKLNKLKTTTLAYNKKIIESSDVAETLVKSLAFIVNDLDMKLTVLGVLQKFSKNSPVNCDKMLQAEAAGQLCTHMMDNDKSGLLLFRSTDILWNLLETGGKERLAQQLSNNICIGNIRDAFIHQLTYGYSHYDRQLRNDLLVIASLVASCTPDAPFIEIGFIKQLTLFATFQEVKNYHFLVKHLKLMPNHEDFELKKLLINILVILSHDSAVVPLLSEGRLLLALFSYVRANEKTSGPREWTPAEMEELQLHAMAALCTLAPIMIDDYMMCQGSTRLLLLLEWCVGTDDFGGDGNSFYAVGGRGNKRAQMRHCLRLMKCMMATGDENVLQDFADQGAINQLTGILRMMQQRDSSNGDEIEVEMQYNMLFVLSTLCEHDMHRKELFGEEGVDVLVSYLQLDLSLLTSGLGHQLLLLAAIDCVWCCVFGCYTTEDYFLENEGIFLLIDLLESCPKNMHSQIFGCLLDLAENPKTLPHLNTWRGKDDISAAHLFCEKWREEEDIMGVKRDTTGAILGEWTEEEDIMGV